MTEPSVTDPLPELYDAVLRTARSIVGEDAAQDVAQETFLRLLTSSPPRAPRPWLSRVARNLAIDELRKRRFRTPVASVEDRPGSAPDVDQLLAVREAMSRLPERYKLTLWLKHVEGRTAKEIADMLDTTPSSIELVLFRARRALREAYEDRSALVALLPLRRLAQRIVRRPVLGAAAKPAVVAIVATGLVAASGLVPPRGADAYRRVDTKAAVARLSLLRGDTRADPRFSTVAVASTAPAAPTSVHHHVLPLLGAALDRIIIAADTIVLGRIEGLHSQGDTTALALVRVDERLLGDAKSGDVLEVAMSASDMRRLAIGGTLVLPLRNASPYQALTIMLPRLDGTLVYADGSPTGSTLDGFRSRITELRGQGEPGASATPAPTPSDRPQRSWGPNNDHPSATYGPPGSSFP